MRIQPFRIVESEEPDNFNTIYEFIVEGSFIIPYTVCLESDDFNSDNEIVNWKCTCKDFEIRRIYPDKCKHITECLNILKTWKPIWVKEKS